MLKKFFSNLLSSFVGSWLALVLFVAVAFVVVVGVISQAGLSVSSESKKIPKKSIMKLELNGTIEETERSTDIDFSILMKGKLERPQTLLALTKALAEAKDNSNIQALFIDCKGVSASPATLASLRDAVADFKKSGKKVYAYGDNLSQGDYYVASVADSVFLNPQGELSLSGIGGSVLYMKDFFDKIGVNFQVAKVGTFKSAVEPYTQGRMSEPARAQLDTLYGDFWSIIKNDLAKSRRIKVNRIDSLMAVNLMMVAKADQIRKWGFVDRCVFRREIDGIFARLVGCDKEDLKYVDASDLTELSEWGTDYDSSDQIAVLYACGDIAETEEAGINCDKLVPEIVKLADDDNVRGLVLRVNSPGGSVFGSAQIGEALAYFKSKGKTFAVSMGDYAASGGYWISCEADRIFANPLTITGSIGIFGLFPNGKGLLDKLGISPQNVSTNPESSINIPFEPLTEFQMDQMQKYIVKGYDQFVGRVAKGRKMPEARIRQIAEGRVYGGEQALRLGLVDEMGSLFDAVKWVAAKSGVKENHDVAVYPRFEPSFWDMIQMSQNLNVSETLTKYLEEKESDRFLIKKGLEIMSQKPVQARSLKVIVRL